ncbi:hypothetical protein Tco_0556775 [Tanacetum coccineum]
MIAMSWEFTYDASRRFSVNSMRKLISTMSSDNNSHPTRWNKLLPSKVNILTWHVLNKILPTRFNLDSFLVGDVLNIAAAVNFAMLLSGRIMLGVCISFGNLL